MPIQRKAEKKGIPSFSKKEGQFIKKELALKNHQGAQKRTKGAYFLPGE